MGGCLWVMSYELLVTGYGLLQLAKLGIRLAGAVSHLANKP
jgi:hypothetical protein